LADLLHRSAMRFPNQRELRLRHEKHFSEARA
jgi:hypothetical protein